MWICRIRHCTTMQKMGGVGAGICMGMSVGWDGMGVEWGVLRVMGEGGCSKPKLLAVNQHRTL